MEDDDQDTEMKKSEKMWRHSRERKRSKRRETTNDQTRGDMWMNMFLRGTRCNTLSHAVHVNKDEMCANVRENTRCEGVLFTLSGTKENETSENSALPSTRSS